MDSDAEHGEGHMKFSYSTDYAPPAPGADVKLRPPEESTMLGPFPAIVDTGADMCVVPDRYLKRWRLPAEDYGYLRSQWGERRKVAIYSLDIEIGAARYVAVDVVADERGDEIILGRNLLNKLVVTLNGPQQELEIME